MQIDPLIDRTRQPYAYADNNPLNASDPTGLCIGIDGTPQDRACTQNDFFWNGLGPAISKQWTTDTAGLRDGMQFGVPLFFNNDYCAHGSDPSFWAEYGIGVVLGVATLGLGAVGASAGDATATVPKNTALMSQLRSVDWSF